MPERHHVAVAHLLRSLTALTARKAGPNVGAKLETTAPARN
jgi:hypothetical protein